MISSRLALPTPPSSPENSERDDVDNSEPQIAPSSACSAEEPGGEDQPAATMVKKEAEKVVQSSIAQWLKSRPVYVNLKNALEDLKYKQMKTSPEKNTCMIYSFLLCTNQMEQADQWKR